MRIKLHIAVVYKLNRNPAQALGYIADLLTDLRTPHTICKKQYNLHDREQLVTLDINASVQDKEPRARALHYAVWHMHTLSCSPAELAMDLRHALTMCKASMQLHNSPWQCLKPALPCHSALAI